MLIRGFEKKDGGSKSRRRLGKLVRSKRREIERKLRENFLVVFLMGAGGHGLDKRRLIKKALEKEGILAIIAEDDLPQDVAPSLVEEYVLENREVELAFINVESWGSAAEFVQYHRNKRIAPKLRVLVENKYHPLYGRSRSYLTDLNSCSSLWPRACIWRSRSSNKRIPLTHETRCKTSGKVQGVENIR